jgi:hypothetical protein
MAYTTIQDVPKPPALKHENYRLKFMENFYALDVDKAPYSTEFHQWVNGIWWDPPQPEADIVAGDGLCTLTWHKGQQVPNVTIRTMQDFRYGYFEARLRFDPVQGAWPAFWLGATESMKEHHLHAGEFDVMEWMGNTPGKCFANFHKWLPDGVQYMPAAFTVTFEKEGFDFSAFHDYAMFWSPGRIDCYMDGKWFGGGAIDHECELLHYYLMLGIQAGVDWKSDPASLEKIEAEQIQMQIDWVRVWQAA